MSDRVALDRFPPHLWITAVLVLLTVVYASPQIGWVRPFLPADPAPNLARRSSPRARPASSPPCAARGAQPLTEHDADVPAALDRAIRQALSMTPEERPATPQAFASDVARALAMS